MMMSGVDYCWGEYYEMLEEGKSVVCLCYEVYFVVQIMFKGMGNLFWFEVGEVMWIELILVDVKYGIFIMVVQLQGGCDQLYWMMFEGILFDCVWCMLIDVIK